MAEMISSEVPSTYMLGQYRAPMMSSWFFSAGHPFSLSLTFHVGEHGTVERSFARELLLATLYQESSVFRGQGDVGLKRVQFHDNIEIVYLYLSGPFGPAVIAMDAVPLYGFAKRTLDAVPLGDEPPDDDLAEEIAKLDNCVW
jgi:hypothetical protein